MRFQATRTMVDRIDNGRSFVCQAPTSAVAGSIARALNAHDALIDALRAADRALTPTDPGKFSADDERNRIATAQTIIAAALKAAE